MIAHVAPCCGLYQHIVSFFRSNKYFRFVVIIKSSDGVKCSVDPAVISVVFDKDDLCARLQVEFYRGGQTAFRKVAFDASSEYEYPQSSKFNRVCTAIIVLGADLAAVLLSNRKELL